MDVAVAATATLVAGSIIGWGVAKAATRSRTSDADASVRAERDGAFADRERIRNELATAAAERDRIRGDLGATAAERDLLRGELGSTAAERDRLRSDLQTRGEELRHAAVSLAEAQTRLKSQEQVEAQLQQSFARMSTEALQASRQQLLELADDRFRQAGRPLTETLGKVEAQLREIEKERTGAQHALRQQIQSVQITGEQLRAETAALVSALRKPQARGRWGELQLRRCVELAGMTDRCDFVEQPTVTTSDGVLRPDLVVRLLGGKSVVVDSKVTLAAYLEAYEATDDAIRAERLSAHARHLRQHVDSLAGKAYWSQFSPAPEFVILFVPGDAFLAAALDQDTTLLENAFDKKVHIASPTTLISVLRTVAYAWQQQALADNAREVFELGQELYKRLGVFGGHMGKLGRSLTSAVKTYNDSVGSLERNVLSAARKLNEMQITDDALDAIEGVEEPVRQLAQSELIESDESTRIVTIAPPAIGVELDRLADYGINAGGERDDDWRTGS